MRNMYEKCVKEFYVPKQKPFQRFKKAFFDMRILAHFSMILPASKMKISAEKCDIRNLKKKLCNITTYPTKVNMATPSNK